VTSLEGWQSPSLDEIADIWPGRTPKTLDRYLNENPRQDRTVPFYKVGDMNAHPSDLRVARTYLAQEELVNLGVSVLPVDSIVFPKAGGAIATNKKRRIAVPGAVDLNCMAVVPRDSVDVRYLRAWFESFDLTSIADGSVLPQISKKRVAALRIPLPELGEQRRIVDILEDHLSRLDAAESGLASSVARLASLKERSLAAGLLGETLPGPREPHDLTNCGTDDGQLSDLPVGWTWCRLGEIAIVVGGVTKDAKRQSDPAFVEVPYLRVANVQRGRLDLGKVTSIRVPASKAQALRLLSGDVLMNEGGDRDKLARGWVWEGQVEDCIHQNHVFRARVVDGAIEPKLLSWAANTIGGRWAERNGKQSVNLASISLTKIRQMPVPVPPKVVQAELVKQLDDRLQACDRLTINLNEARARTATLRRSLLAAAFSGQLTGRSKDVEMVEEMAGG
jgi:type I restriction enzyme S subunit